MLTVQSMVAAASLKKLPSRNMPTHAGAGVPWRKRTPKAGGRGCVYGSYVDEPLALITPTQKYYYHANHLYSVAALTNQAGGVVERYRYSSYGERTVLAPDGVTTRAASSYNQQVGFTGRYLDKDTSLWYFRARYYSGSLGRFIQREKQGYVDGLNLYQGYFTPNETDPTGEIVWSRCPIDDYVMQFVHYRYEVFGADFKYKYHEATGKGGLRGEILEGMMNESREFFVAGKPEGDCISNIKKHVEARVRIVDAASGAKFKFPDDDHPYQEPPPRKPGETNSEYYNRINNNNTCIYCNLGTQIVFGAGLTPGDKSVRRKRSTWIPGDWGYFKNNNHHQYVGGPKWENGLEGENVIRIGEGKFWGHGMGIKIEKDVISMINSWTSIDGTRKGKASLVDEVWYPSTGLERP